MCTVKKKITVIRQTVRTKMIFENKWVFINYNYFIDMNFRRYITTFVYILNSYMHIHLTASIILRRKHNLFDFYYLEISIVALRI